jgi:hypothetical protein
MARQLLSIGSELLRDQNEPFYSPDEAFKIVLEVYNERFSDIPVKHPAASGAMELIAGCLLRAWDSCKGKQISREQLVNLTKGKLDDCIKSNPDISHLKGVRAYRDQPQNQEYTAR